MKKLALILTILIHFCFLFSIRNWQAYTNTSAIYSMMADDNELLLGTWGGVSTFSTDTHNYGESLNLIGGLSDSDIKAVLKTNQTYYYVTKNRGVDIFINGRKSIPCNSSTGLISNYARNIVKYQKAQADGSTTNMLFIGTESGLSAFEINDDFPYPLFIQNFTTENGLLSNKVNALSLNDAGWLFIGGNNGLSVVHADSIQIFSSWHYFKTNNSNLLSNEIIDIHLRDNQIALATKNGAYYTTFNQLMENHSLNSYFLSDSVNAIYIDKQNNLWCAFGYWSEITNSFEKNAENKQFACIQDNNPLLNYHSNSNDPIFITDFAETSNSVDTHLVWASTWGEGIFSLQLNESNDLDYSGHFFFGNYKQNSISTNAITKLCVDKNSTVWVADGYMGGPALPYGTRGVSSFDGTNWNHYTYKNSPLLSNNILRIDVDQANRKWFGSWDKGQSNPWSNGVSVLDNSNPDSPDWHNISTGLISNTIAEVRFNAKDNKMWIVSHQRGINVLNPDFEAMTPVYLSLTNSQDAVNIHFSDEKTLIGTQRYGIVYWDDESTPFTNGSFWKRAEPSSIRTGYVYGITSYKSSYGTQYWIAMESGLFMFDGSNWYEYTVNRKRRIWNNNDFYDETYYYADEERLFAGNASTPSCIFADPFGRIWIGSLGAGISIYDTYQDKYINLNTGNSPLLSDFISDIAYDPISGKLFIGTNKGMNTVEIGKQYKTSQVLGSIVAYPNPFYPKEHPVITFKNTAAPTMPVGANSCKIFDLNGQLVRELDENRFFEFEWNGKNDANRDCAAGIYFYLIQTNEGSKKGKFVLIR
jgi:ligand-binding sensor domain-containing protein